MCGIFGAVGPVPRETLDAVGQALYHRGPDGEGRFVDGEGADQVLLLHRRLRIIDLSELATQPFPNEDGTVQVLFNGEIYNHHALRRELKAFGHTFRSPTSDTEVIVHGWEQWGAGVIERLDGMFAIAIWDRRTKQLLLARDRAGKKPLFFSTSGGAFRFGSTVSSLHASGLPRAASVAALPAYLSYGWVPPPGTFYEGVEQLQPGELILRERDGSFRRHIWFEPRFAVDKHAPVDDLETATRRVRELVTAAVERRLEADVPLGAFLSGGIDSSIVVGVMSRLAGRVRTFSIGFAQDARYDETEYARLAAQTFGSEHTEFTLEPSSFDLVEKLVAHHDGPFGDSSAIPTYVVSMLTRRSVTVALSGDGGDELFCGYERFLAAEAAERIPLPMRELASTFTMLLPEARKERSLLGKAGRFLRAAELPLDERMARWNSFFPYPHQLLRGDVAETLGEAVDAPLDWQRRVFADVRSMTTLGRILEHNFRTYLPNDLLVKADRTSMAHGLELRAPFLDKALFEYVSQLPAEYLRRGLRTKWILRRAFADILPPKITRRGKMGFGVPLGTWFRTTLRGYLHDMLGDGARVNDYLDATRVSALLDDHFAGRADHGQRIWALITLELWLRSFASAAAQVAA
jgi:asparagine synthase (glutamine-hydrolysing)